MKYDIFKRTNHNRCILLGTTNSSNFEHKPSDKSEKKRVDEKTTKEVCNVLTNGFQLNHMLHCLKTSQKINQADTVREK
jgi:hypothetical protein